MQRLAEVIAFVRRYGEKNLKMSEMQNFFFKSGCSLGLFKDQTSEKAISASQISLNSAMAKTDKHLLLPQKADEPDFLRHEFEKLSKYDKFHCFARQETDSSNDHGRSSAVTTRDTSALGSNPKARDSAASSQYKKNTLSASLRSEESQKQVEVAIKIQEGKTKFGSGNNERDNDLRMAEANVEEFALTHLGSLFIDSLTEKDLFHDHHDAELEREMKTQLLKVINMVRMMNE